MHYMDMKKFLKNLLWKYWSDFEIISQSYSLGNPFQKLFAKFQSVKKHGFGPLKNSGEWSRSIKALLLIMCFWNE